MVPVRVARLARMKLAEILRLFVMFVICRPARLRVSGRPELGVRQKPDSTVSRIRGRSHKLEVLMFRGILAVVLSALVVSACRESATRPDPVASTVPPSSLAAMSVERPWRAHVNWSVTGVRWAGVPGQAKSVFEGRCSVASDYVVSATFEGEATHVGRVTGQTEHCTQITWSPQGQPIAVTYTDGGGAMVSANGSRLSMRYGNGVTGFDAATGETWFRDSFTLTGETGLFEGATGAGREGGRFLDFTAVLGGAPVPMWMEGTITYGPGRGGW
jgi:hypothetical protein